MAQASIWHQLCTITLNLQILLLTYCMMIMMMIINQGSINLAFLRSSLGVIDLCMLSGVKTNNAALAVPPSCIKSSKCWRARSRSIATAKNSNKRVSNGSRNGLNSTDTHTLNRHVSDVLITLCSYFKYLTAAISQWWSSTLLLLLLLTIHFPFGPSSLSRC